MSISNYRAIDDFDENRMNTKLLAPAALALTLGVSSWSAGAATSYTDVAPVVKSTPVNASDLEAAKSSPTGPEAAMYVNKSSRKFAPSAVARAEPEGGAFRTSVGPAKMFQLRDAARG